MVYENAVGDSSPQHSLFRKDARSPYKANGACIHGKEQTWKIIILKIEVAHQSERRLLIQQDMAWSCVQIVKVMDMS
jgi:hypothetical protein